MVYTRRYNHTRRRFTRKRIPWYRKKYDALSLASKAAKGVWYLKGLVNSEMLHNQSLGSTTVNNVGVITLMNAVSQGDTSSARTGNSILMRNLHLRLVFTQHPTAVSTIYRVMVVLDKQQVGDTTPAVTDILESANPLSPLATANVGRFKVLKSFFFTTDDDKSQTKIVQLYKDMRIHTRFNGTGNSDIQKNGLYLVMISDQATNVPTVNYSWKVGYHDN